MQLKKDVAEIAVGILIREYNEAVKHGTTNAGDPVTMDYLTAILDVCAAFRKHDTINIIVS